MPVAQLIPTHVSLPLDFAILHLIHSLRPFLSGSVCQYPHVIFLIQMILSCVSLSLCVMPWLPDSSSRLRLHALSFRDPMDFAGLFRLLWSLLISYDCGGLWSGAWESQGMEQTCLPQGLQCLFSTARTASTSTFTRKLWNLLASIVDCPLCHVLLSPTRTSPLLSSASPRAPHHRPLTDLIFLLPLTLPLFYFFVSPFCFTPFFRPWLS